MAAGSRGQGWERDLAAARGEARVPPPAGFPLASGGSAPAVGRPAVAKALLGQSAAQHSRLVAEPAAQAFSARHRFQRDRLRDDSPAGQPQGAKQPTARLEARAQASWEA